MEDASCGRHGPTRDGARGSQIVEVTADKTGGVDASMTAHSALITGSSLATTPTVLKCLEPEKQMEKNNTNTI